MKSKAMILTLAALLMLPSLVGAAVSEKDFEVKTTQDLIDLCTASSTDPLYNHAVNFCHGYLVGAFQYYAAAAAGPDGVKLVCMPEPPPHATKRSRCSLNGPRRILSTCWRSRSTRSSGS